MSSPRRVSARQSSASTIPHPNGTTGSPASKLTGKAKASARDSGAAMISPIKKEEALDRSSDIELVSSKGIFDASTSTLENIGHSNGVATEQVKATVMSVATRFSSEELTDIEELDKALVTAVKKPAQRKRKAKGKEISKSEGDAKPIDAEDGAEKAKPAAKPKKQRTKKKQGPYLPVVDYPERDLTGKKFIGAHVSISEAAHYAPHRALRLGARAFGLFVKSQRQWAGKPLSEDSIKLFPLRCKGKTELEPDENGMTRTVTLGDGQGFDPLRHIVPHGSYLTNLCHNGEEQRKKSYDNFLTELKMAEALGIGLFNFHPGSTLGQPRDEAYAHLANCINEAHKETKFITVLLENMASTKNIVGGKFEDLAAVIALVHDKGRIGVCFDTCHGFAAGYDLRSEDAYNETWKQFDEIVGLKYLKAFHVNDSMKELASGRDLHQNIGAGELGLSSFHLLMRDPRFDNLPFILETPMLSGSLNVDAGPSQAYGQLTPAQIATSSKVKSEVKVEEDGVDGMNLTNGDDADVEDNETGATGLTLGATTWKREIELLQELQKVPFGHTTPKIDELSREINEIVAEYRRKQEAQEKIAKEAKDAAKEAKKAAQLAEKGEKAPLEKKPAPPRASKKAKAMKVEVIEREPSEELEIDSSEVDQLASDYEEPPAKV